ncbi:MAG: flavodoxin family protein [Candidatus Bathyarchaeia archaeon]
MVETREPVKVLGIVGSPRKGNTELLVSEALRSAEEVGNVETELIQIANLKIHPCIACFRCFDEKAGTRACPSFEDDMDEVYPRLARSDGIIIGSPVYFGGISGQLKTLLDRTEPFVRYARTGYGGGLSNKVGGAISVGYNRNGGQETSIQMIHCYFLVHDMIVVGSGPVETPGCYYGGGSVTHPKRSRILDAVAEDELGLRSAKGLGEKVARVAKIVKGGNW